MATDVNTLLSETRCYECLLPGMSQLLKLGLLKQILLANNPMADTSINALLEAAKCYECLPPGMQQLIELALLQQIAANGGGGGGGGTIQVYQGAFADPNGNLVPDDPTKPALYFPDGGGTLWQFNVLSQTWV